MQCKLAIRLICLPALLALLVTVSPVSTAAQSPSSCPKRSTTPAQDSHLIQDCNTLLELSAVLGGTITLNWARDRALSSWEGVTITPTAGVTNLQLANRGFTGTIPAALGSIPNLDFLDLGQNRLTGSIPPEMGDLTNVTILNLSNNQLTGVIPSTLGNLTNVTQLAFSNNQLTGPIPSTLGNLTRLERLLLDLNRLRGPIPSTLGNLTSLVELNLNENFRTDDPSSGLTGPIPPELGNLANLVELRLYENKLTGSIPAAFGNLASVQRLSLFDNRLTGPIPPELGNLTNLRRLFLQRNRLTGPIPRALGDLTNLRYLFLHENRLTGPIPPELDRLASLLDLSVSDNRLTGPIPPELGNLTNLRWLWLHKNRLTGDIPPELGSLAKLEELFLHQNRLTGSISRGLVDPGDLASLGDLNVSCNPKLAGPVPGSLFDIAALTQVTIYGTDLALPAGLSEADRQKVVSEGECPVTAQDTNRRPDDKDDKDDKRDTGDASEHRVCPPVVPALLPTLGQTAAATAYALPGDRVLLHLHDFASASVVLAVGRISADAATLDPGDFIREAERFHTYTLLRREADGLIVRHWIAPEDPLINAVPWNRVNAQFTFPAAVLAAIPLDDRHAAPNQLARQLTPADDRILAFDAARGQWWHVSDLVIFQALGFAWDDVTVADADFIARLGPERAAPFPRIIGQTAIATAYLVPGDRLVLHRHDALTSPVVINIGWISADGATVIPNGYVRDVDSGHTYAVLRRESDGLVVRRWIAPTDPLIYAIPWDRVTTRYTFPAAVLATIPLDELDAPPSRPPPPLATAPVADAGCAPPTPPLPRLIGQTATATAYELPSDHALLYLHDAPADSVVLSIGWICASGASRLLVDVVRDNAVGHTYGVVRREADGLVVRHWIAPTDPLIYAIPWDRVTTRYTFLVAALTAFPLDERHPQPDQWARRFDGADDRVFAYTAGQWWHVPHPAFLHALGSSWDDVTAADVGFTTRIAPDLTRPLPRIIGQNAVAAAYEVPGDRVVLYVPQGQPTAAVAIDVGRLAADGTVLRAGGYIRAADSGRTYTLVRRAADERIVRFWIDPADPLIYAISWDRVTTRYTFPAAVLDILPLAAP